ncbi:exodeoxyribonuclease V subunit gamma [Halomonas eurihalina]|uniref:RecBCD enzyme subunit RecC n=1 Tax=Halomonas eurihalina TaxID=42566 RepID=A0A5D9D8H2_HALER|nr:exodeoxyribonuclease V subunit gamma [Halomonas eurihalina]MDR5859938.1 exodeoxyribonuclease V subunit gamma [Halomonas eurihalina]TZG39879.1 exodeoxyribonuclease V subunit gamma [Halomonas eurihalina]
MLATSDTTLQPGFMVVHGNRLEDLRDLAVTWMRSHPLTPLEDETILVQSNGISQWLKLALAADDPQGSGVAAALDVTLPARFLWQAYRSVLVHRDGEGAVPPESPLDKPRLIWRLMRLLPALLDDPLFAPLSRFLADDDDLRKRHQLAERLADLFDQYQVYRADWLAAWAEGHDALIDARGQARPLDDDQRWQPALWRYLRDDISQDQGAAGLATSRALVHSRFLEACKELTPETRPPGLPRRVMVFGISSLPRQTLEALAAIARVSQVILCVHNPCRHYWADIIEHKDLLRAARKRQQRRPGMPIELDDTQLHLHAQPLLAAWGKQGRDYLRLLDEFDDQESYRARFEAESLRIDLFESPQEGCDAPGLLQQLQDDILELRPPSESRDIWPAVDPERDTSLRFHVAHSALREVEILHDQLLAAFDADPSLKPRDILVMVPDIDTYTAAVQAVFGRLAPDDPRHIPFTLSDQTSRHRQPLLIALEALLHLPESRLSVGELLDLLEVPALRQRFGLDTEALPVLRRWIEGAGIRWGLSADQRARLDLPDGLTANTWAFGLRRLLLGYAVGDNADGPWHGIEPFGDIGGLEAALAGPLVDLLDTLDTLWRHLSEPADVATWCQRLRELLADCFSAADEADLTTLTRLEELLDEWRDTTEDAGLEEPLPLSVVREHWLGQIDGNNLSQRFLAGAVNIATLMPMRAIPFRHVCLLGMNDGDYPRTQRPLDIDLMGHDYRPGDRSRREDDRYLFLEALLSARERLMISWVGRSIHDNALQPPSVLLGQLRDHLADGWRLAGHTADEQDDDGQALLDALTTEHPLQPFSRDYFRQPNHADATATQAANKGLFTYAHEWRAIHTGQPDANEHLEPGSNAVSPNTASLPAMTQETPLTLKQLGAFLKDPVKAFFNTRLGVYLEREAAESPDHEPFDLDGLAHWQLQNELIDAGRRAVEASEPPMPVVDETLARLEREGRLAMGGFAQRMREDLVAPLDDLFTKYAELLDAWPHARPMPAPVSLSLDADGGELAVEDWLGELRENDQGETCRLLLLTSSLINQSKYNWKHWLTPWVEHLAAQIAVGPVITELRSRAGEGTLYPLPADEARARLTAIASAWQAGMTAPLPLARDTAFAWIEKGGDASGVERYLGDIEKAEETDLKAAKAAVQTLEGNDHQGGELSRDAYLARQWRDFDELARHQAAGRRFGELAERLYGPLHYAVKVIQKQKSGTAKRQPRGDKS